MSDIGGVGAEFLDGRSRQPLVKDHVVDRNMGSGFGCRALL